MRGLLPPTPSGTPPGGLATLGLSDRLARPGNVKEEMSHQFLGIIERIILLIRITIIPNSIRNPNRKVGNGATL
eukprot:636288-Prorocentrum_minimum.AAC.1